MLQQRGLLLHQHESLACQQDSEWISLLLVLFLHCFFSFQHFVVLVPFSCYTKLDRNQSTQLRNALICITSHPAAVGHSLAATGQEVNMIQSRTVAQSCNHYINFFTHQRKNKRRTVFFHVIYGFVRTPLTFIFPPPPADGAVPAPEIGPLRCHGDLCQPHLVRLPPQATAPLHHQTSRDRSLVSESDALLQTIQINFTCIHAFIICVCFACA